MKKVLLAAAAVILVLFLVRPPRARPPVQVSRLALSTVVTVKVYAGEEEARPLIDRAFAEIARIDTVMSRHLTDSEVNRATMQAWSGQAECSPELSLVLERSQQFAELSGGAFDVTVGALTRLWGFPDAVAPPAPGQVDSARALTGYRELTLEGRRLRLARPGITLDLGGVAKGYAVDRAVAVLQAGGIAAGLVDAGGNIRYFGTKPDGRPWSTGIQHPRQTDGVLIATVEGVDLPAVATSGDYQQYFELDGRRYHHLLDPATGYPAQGVISATAWAASAMEADILSTTVFVLGPERGIALADSLESVEALVILAEGDSLRCLATPGVAGRYRFLNSDI